MCVHVPAQKAQTHTERRLENCVVHATHLSFLGPQGVLLGPGCKSFHLLADCEETFAVGVKNDRRHGTVGSWDNNINVGGVVAAKGKQN